MTTLPLRAPKVVALLALMAFVLVGTTGRVLAEETGASPSALDAGATGSVRTVDTVAPNPVTTSTREMVGRKATDPPSTDSSVQVTKVKLTAGVGTGSGRFYVATVFDSNGNVVKNADLDLGGLGADPDLRVPTVPMKSTDGGSSYSVKVTFPADGDWVLVVRVHSPTQYVDLFTENIAGAGAVPTHEETSNTPSRRAVRAIDPTFYDRYNPYGATGSTRSVTADPAALRHGVEPSTIATHVDTRTGFDLTTAAMAMLHTLGAISWVTSVLGLVLSNRVGPGSARDDVAQFIADRYLLLAGGGLALVALSGVTLVRDGSAGLTDLPGLFATNLGVAYAAVFAAKLVLVGFSIVTTWRIAAAISVRPSRSRTASVASLGAMGDSGPSPRTLALAERNLILGALIIGCVVVLGQLHHALH